MKSSRLLAFETLHKIFYDGAYSNLALDVVLNDIKHEKAFISALVYGVVERKITLDWFINRYLQAKPKPKIMTILRLGAYQILFMDKVPVSAAINESVKLCKEISQDYYTGLVNAVLHKIDENREFPDDISIQYAVPQNLIKMWGKAYGQQCVEEFLPYINGPAPLFAVPNIQFVDSDKLIYELMCEGIDSEISGELVRILSPLNIKECVAFQKGLFHIQDKSSYECCKTLAPKSGETVLDICAAPGGKSFTLAGLMKNEGRILSFDLHESRIKLIADGAKRLGFDIIDAQQNDGTVFNPLLPKADKVLCDVPCSGFGIIRRKPEIRHKELDSIKNLPAIQKRILSVSSSYLKCGGKLVYSTCTLNKRENEKVVQSFLEGNKDFSLLMEKTIFPGETDGDGFYFALLERI